MHLHPTMPSDLRDRVGELLQPRFVGAAAVMEHGMGEDDDRLLGLTPRSDRRERRVDSGGGVRKAHGARRRGAIPPAILNRFHPELLEALPRTEAPMQLAPLGLDVVLE